jgi:hypothetical protein
MKIYSDDVFKCQYCGAPNKAITWDTETFRSCRSRIEKREFQHLNNSIAIEKDNDTYYKCPRCKKWSKGSQLVVVKARIEEVKHIKRDSIIEISNKL